MPSSSGDLGYEWPGPEVREHDGVTVDAKRVKGYVWDSANSVWRRMAGDASGNIGTTNTPSGTQDINITKVGGNAVTEVPVTMTGVVDATNSTTTPLAGGATFTGTSVNVLPYSYVMVLIYSNVASATDGVKIEFSTDGTNWDDATTETFTPGSVGPNQGQSYTTVIRGQYTRVVYTNGGTIQTTFRLQTILMMGSMNGDVLPITSTISTSNHASLVKAEIVGVTTGGGGGYVTVKVNPSGALTVDGSGVTQPVSGTVTANAGTNLNTSLLAVESGGNLATIATDVGKVVGTWGYNAGTSGTLTLTGGKRVLQISAIAEEAAATITINSGDTITLPYGSTDKVSSAIEIKPVGNLTNPTIIFTSTKAYFVEYVS